MDELLVTFTKKKKERNERESSSGNGAERPLGGVGLCGRADEHVDFGIHGLERGLSLPATLRRSRGLRSMQLARAQWTVLSSSKRARTATARLM